jgi:hypothetical protein
MFTVRKFALFPIKPEKAACGTTVSQISRTRPISWVRVSPPSTSLCAGTDTQGIVSTMCLSTFSPLNSDNHANVETAHGTHDCLQTINDITTTLTERTGMNNTLSRHTVVECLSAPLADSGTTRRRVTLVQCDVG